jgi:hypothetical protein
MFRVVTSDRCGLRGESSNRLRLPSLFELVPLIRVSCEITRRSTWSSRVPALFINAQIMILLSYQDLELVSARLHVSMFIVVCQHGPFHAVDGL